MLSVILIKYLLSLLSEMGRDVIDGLPPEKQVVLVNPVSWHSNVSICMRIISSSERGTLNTKSKDYHLTPFRCKEFQLFCGLRFILDNPHFLQLIKSWWFLWLTSLHPRWIEETISFWFLSFYDQIDTGLCLSHVLRVHNFVDDQRWIKTTDFTKLQLSIMLSGKWRGAGALDTVSVNILILLY